MAESKFNPYHVWLGLSELEQSADHYRLLGLDPFEADETAITEAAAKRIVRIRNASNGERLDELKGLSDEIGRAEATLLDPEAKAEYDRALRSELQAYSAAHGAEPRPADSARKDYRADLLLWAAEDEADEQERSRQGWQSAHWWVVRCGAASCAVALLVATAASYGESIAAAVRSVFPEARIAQPEPAAESPFAGPPTVYDDSDERDDGRRRPSASSLTPPARGGVDSSGDSGVAVSSAEPFAAAPREDRRKPVGDLPQDAISADEHDRTPQTND